MYVVKEVHTKYLFKRGPMLVRSIFGGKKGKNVLVRCIKYYKKIRPNSTFNCNRNYLIKNKFVLYLLIKLGIVY